MASTFLILSAITSLLAMSAMADNNFLLSSDTLGTDKQLSYEDTNFIMQGDCNLVLYNNHQGFQSNTHGSGFNCTLTLTNTGQFLIRNGDGSTVWTTPDPKTKKGNYAAVLRPDGEVTIYGPAVWHTPLLLSKSVEEVDAVGDIPTVKNLFFSGQTLYDNAKLTSRDYTFIMKDDCNLVLEKVGQGTIWSSKTAGKGLNCFTRLNHRGQINVVDDGYKTLWRSSAAGARVGDYVLILQGSNGQAVVYGPAVWSTRN